VTVKQTAPLAAGGASQEVTAGLLFGVGAYGIWGLLPLYFATLAPASPIEIVAARVVFSLLVCIALIMIARSWRSLGSALRNAHILRALALAAVLIAVNWLMYTYGVISGRVVEAALGYFINPLVSVLLGVIVLKERLRPLQWTAVSMGGLAVVVLAVSYGQLPWIALTLALSFGSYGLVKKKVGGRVDATTSLTVETIILAPLAAVVMVILEAGSRLTLLEYGAWHFWLLAAGGIITAVPLLFFGAAARRLPLTTIGLLQYLTPLLQFIIAITVFGDRLPAERWIGFCIVWAALILLSTDMLIVSRRKRVQTPIRD
jgi:chloramphenicol-sensitive protein RarD